MKKHQTIAVTTAAVLMLSATGMSVFSFVVSDKNSQLNALNSSLVQKNDELDQKNVALKTSVRKEAAARLEAVANAEAAREQSRLALSTLTAVVRDIQGGLKNVPGASETRRNLLNTSLAKLDAIATKYVEQTAVDNETVLALVDMGLLVLDFGEDSAAPTQDDSRAISEQTESAVPTAMRFLSRAQEIAELLVEANPQGLLAQQTLVRTYDALGKVHMRKGRSRDALKYYRKSLARDSREDR